MVTSGRRTYFLETKQNFTIRHDRMIMTNKLIIWITADHLSVTSTPVVSGYQLRDVTKYIYSSTVSSRNVKFLYFS